MPTQFHRQEWIDLKFTVIYMSLHAYPRDKHIYIYIYEKPDLINLVIKY